MRLLCGVKASMNDRDRQETEVRIILRKDSGGRILHVYSEGSPQGRKQVEPLCEFFRKRGAWPGRGNVVIIVSHPKMVESVFTIPRAVPGYPELRQRAGIKWEVRQSLWGNADHLHV